ncbi:hypothetical protein CERSUDRAFT_62861 [Gelatoporia subvermispora B]|uniref:DUF4050 domain-containing protein n=1 Tax=Ceriporiopsis subvermispora (strain B) TaxID=914234 RepID=M2QUY0_CERS8|nr:hypothetical protein CERSUDRAFT_62861 [Gelatoporia subvermispora B]
MSSFDDRMARAELPPPGPAYFAARRALWCTSPENVPIQTASTFSIPRLEELLAKEDVHENEEYWNAGIKQIHTGLMKGVYLKKRLPLSTVLKVLQCGWIRDGTWPKGSTAPDSDNEHQVWGVDGIPLDSVVLSTTTPDCVSGGTSPWSTEGRNDNFQSFMLKDGRSSGSTPHHAGS